MNTMDDLRSELFLTLASLRKGETDVATAKAIAEISQAVINTAKAEADFARATGQVVCSGLINTAAPVQLPAPPAAPLSLSAGNVERQTTKHGYVEKTGNITRHTLK